MNEELFFRGSLLLAALIWAALGCWTYTLNGDKLPRWEKLPRNRAVGALLGCAALIWCIPHARPVVFDWMVPYLWPMAIGGTVLGYCFLDYLFARAAGGLLILVSYHFVHGTFDFHTQGAPFLAILYWIIGVFGICISGKPYWLRDLLRALCGKVRLRLFTCGFLLLLGVATLLGGLLPKAQ